MTMPKKFHLRFGEATGASIKEHLQRAANAENRTNTREMSRATLKYIFKSDQKKEPFVFTTYNNFAIKGMQKVAEALLSSTPVDDSDASKIAQRKCLERIKTECEIYLKGVAF